MLTATLLLIVTLSPAANPMLTPSKLDAKPGKPLTVRSLVLAPAPLKGTFGWTIEPRLHRAHAPVMTLSPDGKTIATGGSYDGTAKIWEVSTGLLVRTFDATTGKIRGSWLAEADQIVAVSVDGHVRADGKTADDYLVIVQTEKGQEMLTASQFAEKFK